jgi:hypothetical protein
MQILTGYEKPTHASIYEQNSVEKTFIIILLWFYCGYIECDTQCAPQAMGAQDFLPPQYLSVVAFLVVTAKKGNGMWQLREPN